MSESDIDLLPDDVSPEIKTGAGPGQRLKQARERAGLSISEIAGQLHLGEDLVVAMENNDHSKLPGPVFTKGYMRNYARLVNEPVDEVLQALPDSGVANEERPALRQFSYTIKAQQVNSSNGVVKTVSWLIVLGLIVLLIVWWRGYLPISIPVPMLGTEPTPPAVLPVGGSSSDAIVLEKPASAKEATEPAVDGSGSLPVFPEVAPPAKPAAEGDTTVPPARPDAGVSESTPAQQRSIADGADTVELASTTKPTQGVVFDFTSACWVDIRDSNGRKVLYGGIGSGERHLVEGPPPYKVVLGDSGCVDITVNGQAVEPQPAIAGKRIARFALNPDDYGMVAAGLQQ